MEETTNTAVEITEIDEDSSPARPPARKIWLVLAVVGVLLLAGAAFLGARLISGEPLANVIPFGLGGKFGGPVMTSIKLNIERAPEIPNRPAETGGMITEVGDSILKVSKASQGFAVSKGGGPKSGVSVGSGPSAQGPSVEVVVTHDTKIYKDVTFEKQGPPSEAAREGEEIIQQEVEEMKFSEIEKDNPVTVWGYRRGDRIIAEVIVYSKPVVIYRK